MKKYLSFMAFAMIAVFCLSLTSCSNDDEAEEPTASIVGTWKVELDAGFKIAYEAMYEWYTLDDYMQLKADGRVVTVFAFKGKDRLLGELYDELEISKDGRWRMDGNLLYDNEANVVAIIQLTESKLKLRDIETGITMIYTRVPDSEIEKYLKDEDADADLE